MSRVLRGFALVLCCAGLTIGCGDSGTRDEINNDANGSEDRSPDASCSDEGTLAFCEVCIPPAEFGECLEGCAIETADSIEAGCLAEQSDWYRCVSSGPCGLDDALEAGFRCAAENSAYVGCLVRGGGGDGGGDGPVERDFGTIALSGPDTAIFGTTYTPVCAVQEISSTGDNVVIWTLDADANAGLILTWPPGESRVEQFVIEFSALGSPTGSRAVWGCDLSICPGLELDVEDKTLTFDDGFVGAFPENRVPGNSATDRMFLNGTISFEGASDNRADCDESP